ncbi:MAG: hypothetical protein GKR90_24870 [Pseudomonadales bacterium]|nr:hypothetical protein [Pseudomonadales bacterium]
MNPFEKQIELGRELMELNTQWFQKITEFDATNLQKYVEMNQEFASRLPEVKDVQTFAELQREYGETLWSATQNAFQARGELLREAVEANGDVVKTAFNTDAAPELKAEEKVEEKAA